MQSYVAHLRLFESFSGERFALESEEAVNQFAMLRNESAM